MKTRLVIAVLTIATLASMPAPACAAEGVPMTVTLGPGSVLWLEGTSTVHDFECRTGAVRVELTRSPEAAPPSDAAALLALIRASAVRGVHVQVPVDSLRSGKDGLDKRLRKAMRSDQHPNVRFALTTYALTPRPAGDDTVAIAAEGSLTITGVERAIDLAGRAWRSGEGVWLEGSETLLMSDYGIKPPTMMLGTLKVRDPITVRYRLFLIPRGEGSGSPPNGK